MLEHEKIIRRMSLKDKITFLFSSSKFRNSELEDFEFPLFNISNDVAFLNKNQSKLNLSNKAIASTWNREVFKDIYLQFSKNLDANGVLQIFKITGNVLESNTSEDYYLNTQVSLSNIEMLRKNKTLTCLSLIDFKPDFNNDYETTSLTYESVFKNARVDSILVSSLDDLKYLRKQVHFKGYFFGYAKNVKDAIKFMNAGAVVTFLEDVDEEELQKEIVKAMNEYAFRASGLKDEMITQEHFDRSIENGEITSIDIINKNCNQLIKVFVEISKKNVVDNDVVSAKNFTPFAKKVAIDDCAEQSIILLKNENNILPLKHKTKIAVLGDSINKSYDNALVKDKNPLDYLKNCEELVPVGYAQGYMLNHPTDAILVNDAYNLAISADVSLIYLSVDKTGRVPTNQLTLLNTLKKNGIKIIAVLNSPNLADFSFVDYCDAALYSYFDRNFNAKPVLDTIIGELNPCGKLVETILLEELKDDNVAIPLYAHNLMHKFPFGYGLSYTKFEYTNLEITDKGIRFTLTNVGNTAGYAVAQMYVQKEDTKYALRNRLLKGFDKVYLRKGEATKVFIEFDEDTFKYYNVDKKSFGVEEGTYKIFVAESYDDIKLEGEITVSGYLYGEEKYQSVKDDLYKEIEDPFDEFLHSQGKDNKSVEKGGISKKTKIIFAGAIGGVFALTLGFVLVSYFISVGIKFDPFTIVMLALLALTLGATAVLILIFLKQKDVVVENDDVNGTLTEMVENIGEFYEETKEVYATYVPQVEEEEIVKEISNNPEYEEEVHETINKVEEIERKYVANYESNSTAVTFNNFNSIDELCSQFMQFTRTRGIGVEIESARRLWSAILASKLVFLTSNDKELLNETIKCLIEYLGSNTFIQEASNKWKKTKDTLWKKTKSEFLPSNFANSLNNACNSKECLNIVPLVNVRIENLFYYFNDFIENANNPLAEIKIALNDDNIVVLPKNICYILVPEDPSYYDNLPYYISNISFEVNLILERVEKEEEKEFKHISYENLLEIIANGKEKFYMDEAKWKDYDEFEDTVSKTDNFVIGNKATLQMEGFVSCYLECGGDANDINDVLFLSKVVPMMKSTSLYKNEGGDKELMNLIQNAFENDGMSSSIKACNRIEVVNHFVVPEEDESEDNYEEVEETVDVVQGIGDVPISVVGDDVVEGANNVEEANKLAEEEKVDVPEEKVEETKDVEPIIKEAKEQEPIVESKEEANSQEEVSQDDGLFSDLNLTDEEVLENIDEELEETKKSKKSSRKKESKIEGE